METAVLLVMARHFALLSLLAFGGGNTVLPEMHRQAVEVSGWLTDQQFADLFAIAQAAPGPNILIVTLIGWQVAGLAGALVATAAICAPACTLTYIVAHLWERFRDRPWRRVVQRGLAPVTIGIVAAGAFVVAQTVDRSLVAALLTLATVAVSMWGRINPLWVLVLGGIVGAAGWV
ncbi:chromate transporter [Stella humosa]|uniref:Chromate transporter n=1 Tax=Stella humosa TaxID=94 RepID=A0A3N1KZ61_9PROT|nr:chromate transporter [Stella humosa]ROP84447.1 chromate transporter [Stella humosa]BBK33965.1 chromate transporter [Stella humosa]